jgi:ribosomal protein L12E/L44/L45/RPP1/RPP2
MAQVVRRICARVAPAVDVEINPLTYGGVRIEPAGELGDTQQWIADHQIMRELMLVGWAVEGDKARILVLGWSAVQVQHRLRMLRISLEGLQSAAATAAAAAAATDRHHRAHPDADHEETRAAVVTHIARDHLRWPVRLTELDGLERTADLPSLNRLLQRSVELERSLRRACDWHLHVAADGVHAMWEQLNEHGLSGQQALDAAVEQVRQKLVAARTVPAQSAPVDVQR